MGGVVARRSGDALSRKDDRRKRTRASWTRSGYFRWDAEKVGANSSFIYRCDPLQRRCVCVAFGFVVVVGVVC